MAHHGVSAHKDASAHAHVNMRALVTNGVARSVCVAHLLEVDGPVEGLGPRVHLRRARQRAVER